MRCLSNIAQLDTILPRLQVLARSSPEDKFLLVARLNGKSLPRDENSWMAMHQGKPGVVWEKDRDLLLPGYRYVYASNISVSGCLNGVTGKSGNVVAPMAGMWLASQVSYFLFNK